MLRNRCCLLIVLLMMGCATPEVKIEYREVKIPVLVPCIVETPVSPTFYFDRLSLTDDIFEKVKSLLADRKLSQAYINELSGALELCKR